MTAHSHQPDPRRRHPAPQQQGAYQVTTGHRPARRMTNQYPQVTTRRSAWQVADNDEDCETEEEEAFDVREEEEDDDTAYVPPSMPRSAIPYRSTRTQTQTHGYAPASGVPPRTAQPVPNRGLMRQPVPESEPRAPRRRRRRKHWLFYVGLGCFIMVLGWILLGAVSSWWQTTWDGLRYGYPRTYQTDAVVGHSDSVTSPSHFLAINLRSHIEVIEFPGGDVTKARVYVGPTLIGQGQDLAPVTLTFKDVNGDGKLDMIVSVGENTFVYLNDAGQFRPARPGEQLTL